DVVPTDALSSAAEIGGVEKFVEGRARTRGAVRGPADAVGVTDVTQVSVAAHRRAGRGPDEAFELDGFDTGTRARDRRIEIVPRPRQPAEELDHAHVTARDIRGQLLEQPDGALAAAIIDGLGDVAALTGSIEAGDELGRHQVADIRNDPVVARLD